MKKLSYTVYITVITSQSPETKPPATRLQVDSGDLQKGARYP